jgi:hypothetical protein
MKVNRNGHTATKLPGGGVLVAGGVDMSGNYYTSSAEIYDPGTNSWSSVSPMASVRQSHTASLLADGNVLVAGGISNSGAIIPYVELFDPAGATWSIAGSMTTPRMSFTATPLQNSRVLLAGGTNGLLVSNANELYRPVVPADGACGSSNSGTFTLTPVANLCSAGVAGIVTGSGPWSWTCAGVYGGIAAHCSANIQTYAVTTSVTGGNGTVSCTSPVNNGASSTCMVTPATGYQLDTFIDNGVDRKSSVTSTGYSIANITGNHTITATFTLTPVNGVCGTSNNSTVATIPTTNLCSTGSA